MSIKIVENEIQRFLASAEAEAICISGHWGVGKTFAWNKYLRKAQVERRIVLDHYAYVSLFGVISLEELKRSIFENTVTGRDIGVEPSIETLKSNTASVAKRFSRRTASFIQGIPLIKNYVGTVNPLWLLVSETIVCIDDIERRGKALAVRDVLGLISNLKEHKQCKICLILNDEAEDDEKDEFRAYFDKVIDKSLRFDPSPREAVAIALATSSNTEVLLADACIKLGIYNIRLIKRIERLLNQVQPILKGFDQQIFSQAAHTLTLLAWSVYEPNRAPALDYIVKRKSFAHLLKDGAVSESEAAWNALLDGYRFTSFDNFDQLLLDGVRNGFFDEEAIRGQASAWDHRIKAQQSEKLFYSAWERFHDSFDNDQEEVLNDVYWSFMNGVQHVNPTSLDATVVLFKELGRSQQAAEMIDKYIEVHSNERELFNRHSFPFEDLKDPDVIRAFDEQYKALTSPQDVGAVLRTMAEKNGWNPEDITTLAGAPIETLYDIFKSTRGRELRKLIDTCLQFDKIGGATPEMKEIAKRARSALERIGTESAINARRVRKYGVKVDSIHLSEKSE
jgi:hypothetical protein